MAAHLSQEWLDALQAAAGALPERPGATARVGFVVTGAPDGEVRYHQAFADGRLAEAALGEDPAADVTLTLTHAEAVRIATGEIDASAAFMQGKVKVVGPMGKVMALMPLWQSDEYRAALATVSADTAY